MVRNRSATLVVPFLIAVGGIVAMAMLVAGRPAGATAVIPRELAPVTAVFTDTTSAAGIAASQFGHMPGQAWADVDGDGYLDLYLTGGIDYPNVLYQNNGDGTFAISPLSASVAMTSSHSGGAVFGDYNNDGWPDLYVLVNGANKLFRNDGGQGFTDVTDLAAVGDEGVGTTGAWGDYNGDGYLDLYVANWFCNDCPNTTRDTLYRNNGNGTFTDASVDLGPVSPMGPGFVASFLDYDNDGDLDIYLVNDKNYSGTGIPPYHNILWRNDGPGCVYWCFTDVSVVAGADVAVDGMGLAVGDYDNDGDLDLYFSNAGPQVLLQNQTSQGSPTFVEVSVAAGVAFDAIGWGTIFFDYDNDGWLDLYLATMDGLPSLANRLFHNQGNGTFADVSDGSGANNNGQTFGVAYADYDNDGWVDLVIGNVAAPPGEGYVLYRNLGTAGTGNGWLTVRLVGGGPVNRDGIGGRVYLTLSDGRTLMQEVKSGSSLGSGNDLALHFGLGAASVLEAEVVWPDGVSQTFTNVPVNQEWRITYPQFADVTTAAGITATHHFAAYYITGQAWADYDGDGYLDLYVTDSNGPNTLYRNNGDGTFSVSPNNDHVRLDGAVSGGAVFGDYNNDGWPDLLVTNFGANTLLRNDSGLGFTDVTAVAGVGDIGAGAMGAWGDFDGDGWLDLYVANHACLDCPRDWYDILYRNNGNGTFTDVTAALGVSAAGPGLAVSWFDYDNDGDLDIYLVNDKMLGGSGPPPGSNILWRNDGPGCTHWCFADVSAAAGADAQVDGMGLAVGDYDNDGDLDLYFSNNGPAVLLQNQTAQGSPTFVDVSAAAGVDIMATSWGAVFFDYDNDGWPDAYLATMEIDPALVNRLYHNRGDGTFADRSDYSGATAPGSSFGVAYADYDNDGLLDLVVGNSDEAYYLFRNLGVTGGNNDWLRVRLQGSGPVNRDAIGSRVYVTTDDGVTRMQEVKSGSSFGSGNDLALHFGLSQATITEVRVVWSDGLTETFTSVPVNEEWRLTHPAADPGSNPPLYFPIIWTP